MRAGIFLKIFLGFWLATVAILGSWMLVNQYFDAQPRPERAGAEGERRPPPRFVLNLLYQVQHLAPEELGDIVRKIEQEHEIKVYLLQARGGEVFGKPVPPPVRRLERQLSEGRSRAFLRAGGKHYIGHLVRNSPHGVVGVVLAYPREKRGLLNALIEHLWLRALLALLLSGLVCYALSRLMTRRLGQLQLAANRIAGGDLDARLQVRESGGDETDQLARDFNSMAAQLQARMDAQRQLLSDISHELRSPLARLRVALALAQDAPQDAANQLQRMERETERLEALIQQLLSAQEQQRELQDHIDLISLLEVLCKDASFEGKAQGKSALVASTLDQAVVRTTGDLLHRCFENILRNAIRHTAPGTTVVARVDEADGTYSISIEDCGPGLPDVEMARIFDEFYRVDSARRREDGGHGLGLSIARRAVELHGGSISAHNSDGGLKVLVSLPNSG